LTNKTALAVVISNAGLHLRKDPNSNSALITTIPKGDTVKIIASNGPAETLRGKEGSWNRISFKEQEGWVWGGYIERIN